MNGCCANFSALCHAATFRHEERKRAFVVSTIVCFRKIETDLKCTANTVFARHDAGAQNGAVFAKLNRLKIIAKVPAAFSPQELSLRPRHSMRLDGLAHSVLPTIQKPKTMGSSFGRPVPGSEHAGGP